MSDETQAGKPRQPIGDPRVALQELRKKLKIIEAFGSMDPKRSLGEETTLNISLIDYLLIYGKDQTANVVGNLITHGCTQDKDQPTRFLIPHSDANDAKGTELRKQQFMLTSASITLRNSVEIAVPGSVTTTVSADDQEEVSVIAYDHSASITFVFTRRPSNIPGDTDPYIRTLKSITLGAPTRRTQSEAK